MARAALALVLLLAAVGCGGADDASAPAPTTAAGPVTGETAAPPTTEPVEPVETAPEKTPPPPPPPPPEPLPGLPLELAGYEAWPKLNERPIPPRSPDPHEGTKNVHASEPAASGRYPDGTIVVKEARRPGTDFVGLVAMMRKERGAQPDHNDWVWVEWVRDAPDAEFRELASGSVCYSCHVQARATDYVFTP